jgi:glycosyltransferase involved in cell wall biosynthesis
MQPPQAEKKLKILIVVWGLRYGGGETRVYTMAKFMAARGHDVTVCCLRVKGEKGAQLEREGGKVIELGKRYRYDLTTLPRLYRLMRRERFDVVDGQMTSGFRWATVAGRLAGVPRVVATTYNTRFWKSRVRRIIDTLFLRFADVIVTDSRTLIDEVVSLSPALTGKEFRVVYNGVDLATNGPIRPPDAVRRELGLAPGDAVVGLVARVVPHKGHMEFLEAARRIAAEFPSARFLIVGRPEGGYERAVAARIRELGLESRARVFQHDGNIFDIMGVLDLYVLPSYSESLPNAVVEAMWMETPVIATRITGLPEAVVDGETGFLIPTGDPQAIYEKMKVLLSDPGLRRRMGKAGRRFAEERFSPSALGDGALSVYREP